MSNAATLILGIGTAAVIFYIRSCMLLAQKQKLAAIRLQAYLRYWQKFILDNELFVIFHLGQEWNKEIREIIKKGSGTEELVKLDKEKKKEVDGIQKAVESFDGSCPSESPDMTIITPAARTPKRNVVFGYRV